MATLTRPPDYRAPEPIAEPINLGAFRRRIHLLRGLRLAAAGGSVGAIVAIVILAGDWFDWWDMRPWWLAASVGAGMVVGAAASYFENYSNAEIARSIDRRSGQSEDRLTTAFELRPHEDFLLAVRQDAARHFSEADPKALYPIRFQRVYVVFFTMLAVVGFVFVALDTPYLKTLAARKDAEFVKAKADQVQAIARPLMLQAKQSGATAADKQLAKDMEKFERDLAKAHMTKQDALVKANQLADQARKLEYDRSAALGQKTDEAKSAGDKLQQLADQGKMQKTDAAKLAEQAANLKQQIGQLQNQLNAAKTGRSGMSAQQMASLQKQLDAAEKQLQQIKLSQAAQEMLAKLQANPDFQKAQQLLQQLQEQRQMMQQAMNGDHQFSSQSQQQMTEEQMKQIAKQMDELAKKLDSDAKLKAYAKALHDAAEQAKLGDQQGAAAAMAAAFGMGDQPGEPGMNMGGQQHGPGAPGNVHSHWYGKTAELNISDTSSLLHVKFQDRVITSQQGKNGDETYTETLGPSQITNGSGIPYQSVLPKYERTAESAMNKSDIPASERTRVRDYFDSLRK